jgi:hypothetical protein
MNCPQNRSPWSSFCDRWRPVLRTIIGTLAMSGAMNALSFGEHAQGLMLWRSIELGLAIPALVYARTRAGDVLYIQRKRTKEKINDTDYQ